jgi:hypothetical protein
LNITKDSFFWVLCQQKRKFFENSFIFLFLEISTNNIIGGVEAAKVLWDMNELGGRCSSPTQNLCLDFVRPV